MTAVADTSGASADTGVAASTVRVRRGDFTFIRETISWLMETLAATGVPRAVADDLDFCASELLANIAEHAFDDDEPHQVLIRVRRTEDMVQLILEDDGRGFDPLTGTSYVPPDTLDHAGHRGYGVHLVRRFADEMRYCRLDGKNIVTVEKRLPSA